MVGDKSYDFIKNYVKIDLEYGAIIIITVLVLIFIAIWVKKGTTIKDENAQEIEMSSTNSTILEEDALTIFRYKIHLADFEENYKVGAEFIICARFLDNLYSISK